MFDGRIIDISSGGNSNELNNDPLDLAGINICGSGHRHFGDAQLCTVNLLNGSVQAELIS